MTRLSISVPDDLKAKLEARAAESGHPTLESYISALVQDDARSIDYGAPDHLRIRSREQLESLVLEGLNSPARGMKSDEWKRMRADRINRHSSSKTDNN